MQHPTHDILTAKKPWTRQRLAGYALAALVNLAFIWMLIEGLAVHYIKHEVAELKAQVIAPTKPETQVAIPKPTLIVPKDTIRPPEVVVQTPQPQSTITTKMAPASPSTSAAQSRASGITSTHTTPPYPPGAKKDEKQGTVVLHINISAQGDVTTATVSKSSGVPELDQTAVDWVIKHWKYKPATNNGTAVASTSDAQVVFNLKNAS